MVSFSPLFSAFPPWSEGPRSLDKLFCWCLKMYSLSLHIIHASNYSALIMISPSVISSVTPSWCAETQWTKDKPDSSGRFWPAVAEIKFLEYSSNRKCSAHKASPQVLPLEQGEIIGVVRQNSSGDSLKGTAYWQAFPVNQIPSRAFVLFAYKLPIWWGDVSQTAVGITLLLLFNFI